MQKVWAITSHLIYFQVYYHYYNFFYCLYIYIKLIAFFFSFFFYLFSLTIFFFHHLSKNPRPPWGPRRCENTTKQRIEQRPSEDAVYLEYSSNWWYIYIKTTDCTEKNLTNESAICIYLIMQTWCVWKMADLVWGPVQWETLSGGSRGWDPLWTARSCRAFHPGWLGPNRPPGNWGTHTCTHTDTRRHTHTQKKKMDNEIKEWRQRVHWTTNLKRQHINGNYTIICIIAPLIIGCCGYKTERWEVEGKTQQKVHACLAFFPTYSLMAILSECRDDTDDMLWDICKEKDDGDVSRSPEGHWRRPRRLPASVTRPVQVFRRDQLWWATLA